MKAGVHSDLSLFATAHDQVQELCFDTHKHVERLKDAKHCPLCDHGVLEG